MADSALFPGGTWIASPRSDYENRHEIAPMKALPVLLFAAAAALGGCDFSIQKPADAATSQASAGAGGSAPSSAAPASTESTATTANREGLPDFTRLMKSDGPAVVNIISTSKAAAPSGRRQPPQAQEDDPMLEFFRRFMPDQPPGGPGGAPGQPRGGMGSGFIISADGFILTNAHVVADFDEVTVRLADAKREFKAKVIGLDKRTDVALIKVDARDLPTVKLGNSSKVEAGQWVAAIGSPFGFNNTITAGIVSATGRALPDESFVPVIQTDGAGQTRKFRGPPLQPKREGGGDKPPNFNRPG